MDLERNREPPLTENTATVSRVSDDIAQYFINLTLVHEVLVEFVVLGAGRRKGARLEPAGPRLVSAQDIAGLVLTQRRPVEGPILLTLT